MARSPRRLLLPYLQCHHCATVKCLFWSVRVWSGLLCAAGLSSLTSLKLQYVGGQVLPPDGDYISRLRSLHSEGDQAAQVGCGRWRQVPMPQITLCCWICAFPGFAAMSGSLSNAS